MNINITWNKRDAEHGHNLNMRIDRMQTAKRCGAVIPDAPCDNCDRKDACRAFDRHCRAYRSYELRGKFKDQDIGEELEYGLEKIREV